MKNTGKIMIVLMALSFVLMANTCNKEDEDHHKTIEIINNSEKDIYVYPQMTYPDTLGDVGGLTSQPQIYKVESHTRNRSALRDQSSWEDIFRAKWRIPSDTLMVFIMDAELLESNTIHVNNTIIQRYDLSLQDLQYVNWTLTYPPSPNMSAIKMYPPFGQ
jgi:hypothetical protein